MSRARSSYVALSGGVGGAKLSLGLAQLLAPVIPEAEPRPRAGTTLSGTSCHEPPSAGPGSAQSRSSATAPAGMTGATLTIIANTGDDFEHMGLHVSPDVDTALYTLAGVVNPDTGWGRRDETWSFMQAVEELGGPTWFRLGDRDLATHVERTRRINAGETLTAITAHLAGKLGIAARILPMADQLVRTVIDTDGGALAFQDYFVRQQCRPVVRGLRYEGAASARPTPQVLEALAAPDLGGIIVCPSNPWLSIDPILAVPGLREAICASGAPVIAVSPIVGGRAVKGPTAKIMAELGLSPDAAAIAHHYAGLIDGFVLDVQDAALAGEIAVPTLVTNTLMHTLDDKIALAHTCLAFCDRLAERTQPASRRRAVGAAS
jgi:LPPG:FO 2-phospho-L-lactate transferase